MRDQIAYTRNSKLKERENNQQFKSELTTQRTKMKRKPGKHTPRSDGQMHGQEVNVLPKNEAKKARGAEDTEEVVRTTERESHEFFQPI